MKQSYYSDLDFQLLFELRLGMLENGVLPTSTLRLLRARGWVEVPDSDSWAFIEAGDSDDEDEAAEDDALDIVSPTNFALARVRLTPSGSREIRLFRRRYSDIEVYEVLAEEEGVDLPDEPCDDEG